MFDNLSIAVCRASAAQSPPFSKPAVERMDAVSFRTEGQQSALYSQSIAPVVATHGDEDYIRGVQAHGAIPLDGASRSAELFS